MVGRLALFVGGYARSSAAELARSGGTERGRAAAARDASCSVNGDEGGMSSARRPLLASAGYLGRDGVS